MNVITYRTTAWQVRSDGGCQLSGPDLVQYDDSTNNWQYDSQHTEARVARPELGVFNEYLLQPAARPTALDQRVIDIGCNEALTPPRLAVASTAENAHRPQV